MKKEKVGISGIELFLSIMGIMFLLSFIILPPVFRVIFKEKINPDTLVDELKIETLICTKDNYYSEDSKNTSNITMTYYNDKVRTYEIKEKKEYTDTTTYATEKQSLGLLSTAYSLANGIELVVNASDTDLIITTIESCSPGTFKSTTISLPDVEQEFKINSKYTTIDSVKQIKEDLETDGYKCKIDKK